ncbi:methylmalonyl-CoA mutase subunit beta [Ichthyenterobacterium magnum]|uniref:Heterodimeric methylmalonyl-CoA mutase small subunit n=1 Tax=Ichthyenterobacterium magnum TaxID=1230530 RepID=A0A420DGS6_9FLAO|nr:methylmalonyl-CoA mutase subunit beta [Ichthyenterobacterium magnum]RKE92291.1 heterodimeric methylmalonyl-CoA mutase small subunit [Ichthyenterobacterium magnum]
MSKPLFNEFESVSSKEWKQKIQVDLKGADYNDTLIWKTNEDIDVKPFYHQDDFKSLPEQSDSKATEWKICQSIFVANVEKSNAKAIDALQRGAESIQFIIPSEDISIQNLLSNIDNSTTPIYFKLQFLSPNYVGQILSVNKQAQIFIDIIGNLTKSGNWFSSLKSDHKNFETIIKKTNAFSIDLSLYQNAGATNSQQLAYGLAHANEYLNHLDSIISSEAKQTLSITFKVSVGTNYFFEIAKLRALRILWKTLASEYNINTKCHIVATPTKRNKTIYDYNTNMLRTTTECMSAVLGGANTICNLPYDAIYHKDNEFGERISRNQLLVLKHESYFDKVDNPSDGAYYIEDLTQQLSEKALNLFKEIETNGGFLKQLKEGTIQRKIKESANKEQEQFNANEEILLGTNKHPNPNDKMKDSLELYPFVKTNSIKTLIEPIIEKRLAETLEQNRLKTE